MIKDVLKSAILCAILFPTIVLADEFNSNTTYGFIENKGQVVDQNYQQNNNVKYLLNTPGLNVQLRDGGFSYDAYTYESNCKTLKDARDFANIKNKYTYHRVDVDLIGANKNAELRTENVAADYINYHTNGIHVTVNHYQKVTYLNIYNGIDMEFVTSANKPVEYNFIVHPGADPAQIKLQYNGSDKLNLVNGKLSMQLAHGTMHEEIPASFTLAEKAPVSVSYKNIGSNTYSYSVGAYDRTETLIIDPVPDLAWATYYGGSNDDAGRGIKVVGSSVYIAGYTASTNNMATTGAHKTSVSGTFDGFIAKFNTTGTRQWGTYYGGNSRDVLLGMDVSSSGDIIVTGQTESTTGISTSGAHQPSHAGSNLNDGFVAKFNSNGTLVWGTYYGGAGLEYIVAAAVDASGNVFVCGTTSSTTGIMTSPPFQPFYAGGTGDAFIVCFNSNGVRQWANYAGSDGLDEGKSIAVDNQGGVFLYGAINNPTTSYLISSGAHQQYYAGGNYDLFLARYSTANGGRFWGTFFGGSGDENPLDGNHIATDASGNLYVCGSTLSTNGIATFGSYQSTISSNSEDAFLAKFNPSGVLQWSTYHGEVFGPDLYTGISVDGSGNIHTGGITGSTSLLATNNAYQTSLAGGFDDFYSKWTSNGSLQHSTYFGGTGDEDMYALDVDAAGHAFLLGNTLSTSGIATSGAHQTSLAGTFDPFIARMNVCPGTTTIAPNATSTNVSCFGLNDGQITLAPTGGAAPYNFRLSMSAPPQASGTFNNLNAGSYNVIVTDDNSCTSTANITITQPQQVQKPVITGPTMAEITTTETYTTSQQVGLTYLWTATGGSILSGQGTNQVDVRWGTYGAGDLVVKVGTAPCEDTGKLSTFVNWKTGINDVNNTSTASVYPNPTTDKLFIKLGATPTETMGVQIVDHLGKMVLNTTIAKQEQEIDIRQIPSGVYFVKIDNQYIKLTKL